MPAPIPATAAAPTRVLSIDVLRGVTIAFMILVNDPGDWAHTYAQLDHAKWNGFTLTDLVFPTFLFVVGASVILSLSARVARSSTGTLDPATRRTLALRILRRAATIFLLDLFLTAAPFFHLTTLRIYGVLTRIAICYLVVGLLCLFTRRIAVLAALVAAILVGYWALMRFVPVPGFGIPTHDIPLLDPDRNLAAWLDRAVNAFLQRTLHTGRLYEHTRDPEGLLSTLPAIATTLIGSISALWIQRPVPVTSSTSISSQPAPPTDEKRFKQQTATVLVFAALLCQQAGTLWNHTFPINKNLWTSSYVLFSAGCTLAGLALCFMLVDVLRLQHRSHLGRALLWPWLVFGSNAITAYAVSVFFVKTLLLIKFHDSWNPNPATRTSAWGWIYNHLFARGHSTDNTSLAFALAFVVLCFLPNLFLWRKRIFLKV